MILFSIIVLIPGIFSEKIFALMNVHTDIQKDVYHLILWTLPAVFMAGIG